MFTSSLSVRFSRPLVRVGHGRLCKQDMTCWEELVNANVFNLFAFNFNAFCEVTALDCTDLACAGYFWKKENRFLAAVQDFRGTVTHHDECMVTTVQQRCKKMSSGAVAAQQIRNLGLSFSQKSKSGLHFYRLCCSLFFSLLLPSQDAGLGWQKTMRPGLDFHGTRSHGSLATCSQALAFNPRTLESKEGSQDCCNLKLLRTWLRMEICRYFR